MVLSSGILKGITDFLKNLIPDCEKIDQENIRDYQDELALCLLLIYVLLKDHKQI